MNCRTSPMDVIGACLSLVPVPYLSLAFSIFHTLWSTIENVQWGKQQLRALAFSIAQLLKTLHREIRDGHIVESKISPEIASLERTIMEINSFVEAEADRSFLKLLFTNDDRIVAINVYHRRITACVQAFQVSALINIEEWQRQNDLGRVADQLRLDNRLAQLEANHAQLREVLNVHQANMVAMMTTLQKFMIKQLSGERERRFFSHTLKYLSEISGTHVKFEDWMVTSFEVEFGAQIGSGGFGQVFKGTWNRTQVALKVLKTDSGVTPSSNVISREIRTWLTLLHPHIIQFLGANVFDDRPFLVMPYLKNGNARDFICDNPEFSRRPTILHHISVGLAYLHTKNVIHGDLKALNVLIDDSGRAVLCDFGLSRIKIDATSRSNREGDNSVVGSRNWMSPERMLGGSLRMPVDIYAFGMTMFEVLTGEVPLGHIAYLDFIELVVHRDIRPERPEDDNIPDDLWSLVEACWLKDPSKRPNAGGVCDAMERLSRSLSPIITPPTSPIQPSTSDPLQIAYPPARYPSVDGSLTSNASDDPGTPSLNGTGHATPPLTSGSSHSTRSSISHKSHILIPPETDNPLAVGETGTGEAMLRWLIRPFLKAQARTANPIQQLYSFRIDTPERPLPTCRNTTMEKWTLDDLLERWITRSSDISKDLEFQDIFLATYAAFSNCLEVFQGLRNRFDLTEGKTKQSNVNRRVSIISGMTYWVESPFTPIDPEVIAQIKIWANKLNTSTFMREKAKRITTSVERKESQRPSMLLPASSPGSSVRTLLDNTPGKIAATLTAIEGLMYRSVRPADCITYLRQFDGSNRVAEACALTSKITYWVIRELLQPDLEHRVNVLKFFIATAQECYERRNFSSTAAIVKALESKLIQRLHETFRALDPRNQRQLNKLRKFIKPESEYRHVLDSSQDPCVPRLDLHLHDLTQILPNCFPNDDQECASWINFMECVKLAKKMREIIKLKAPSVDEIHEPDRLTYLLQFAHIETNDEADRELDTQSVHLAIEEEKLHNSRVRDLEALGFRVGRGR